MTPRNPVNMFSLELILFVVIIGYTLIPLGAEMHVDRGYNDFLIHRRRSLTKRGSNISRVQSNSHGQHVTLHVRPNNIRNKKVDHLEMEDSCKMHAKQKKLGDSSHIEIEKIQHEEPKMLCPNNHCMFNHSMRFWNRFLEGKFEFNYALSRIIIGKAIMTYKNLKTREEKYFGFEIVIKYVKGEEATVRLSILHGKNFHTEKKGLYIQELVPPICFLDLPPLPYFKLCMKMTRATFCKENRIQLCFNLHVQMIYFFNKELYAKCMNFTTTPIKSFRNKITKLLTFKKLTVKKDCQAKKRDILVEGGVPPIQKREPKELVIPID